MSKTIKRKNHMGFLVLLIFISIIICILLFGTSIFHIRNIIIEGNEYYAEEEILSQAGISKGMHILKTNKKNVSQRLLELSYLKSAQINTVFPNVIEIEVTERKPIGYVPFSGTYLVIDKVGQVIDQTQSKEAQNLPVIEGLKFDKFTLGEAIELENEDVIIAVVELTSLLEKYNLHDKEIKIDIDSSARMRLYINSLDVIIGEINNLDKKIQWLCEIIEEYDVGVLDLSNINEGQAVMSPLT